jgi:hypothetical protein
MISVHMMDSNDVSLIAHNTFTFVVSPCHGSIVRDVILMMFYGFCLAAG